MGEGLPSDPGVYVLVIRVDSFRGRVGSLGTLELGPGTYAYVGSALGPGGLRSRVGRHLGGRRRLRWHIDYLLSSAGVRVVRVYVSRTRARAECPLVAELVSRGAEPAARGFGSSDCGCTSHLLRLEDESVVPAAMRGMGLEPEVLDLDPRPGEGRKDRGGPKDPRPPRPRLGPV